MSLSTSIGMLANYKAWANRDLFASLNANPKITDSEDMAIIIAILNHVYIVDRIFQENLQGETHSYVSANSSDLPTLLELTQAVQELDQWYVDYSHSITDSELNKKIDFCFTDGQPATFSRAEMIFHVVNHGTYHRGNVGVIMQKNSVAPPKDVLTNFLLSETTSPTYTTV